MSVKKKENYQSPRVECFSAHLSLMLSSLSAVASFEDVDFYEPAFDEIDFGNPS